MASVCKAGEALRCNSCGALNEKPFPRLCRACGAPLSHPPLDTVSALEEKLLRKIFDTTLELLRRSGKRSVSFTSAAPPHDYTVRITVPTKRRKR